MSGGGQEGLKVGLPAEDPDTSTRDVSCSVTSTTNLGQHCDPLSVHVLRSSLLPDGHRVNMLCLEGKRPEYKTGLHFQMFFFCYCILKYIKFNTLIMSQWSIAINRTKLLSQDQTEFEQITYSIRNHKEQA